MASGAIVGWSAEVTEARAYLAAAILFVVSAAIQAGGSGGFDASSLLFLVVAVLMGWLGFREQSRVA